MTTARSGRRTELPTSAAGAAPPGPGSPDDPEGRADAGQDGREGGTRRPWRVLVVEDEVIIAWEISETLQRLGYEVSGTARNKDEAVNAARDQRPDVVLMDVRLARGDDGIAAAREIVDERKVPVVFCTAYAHHPPTVSRIAAFPGAVLLAKPMRAPDLETALRRALGRAG